ncbi:GLUG [Sulfurimonas denitrificans DSM 1251]|uniref:GLUG n=1 Tax=Sulfurimonas denitrificans (strain ATCC 33889 / DSM 1251) TaxID=326298 RepID=Q30SK5_SULDN|nr:GLUG motif-containing protein [Sulfurimonas denitrificans]ABB44026.1 GLUG [Sulfurimonas denitrificans DSM 1251]
MQAMELDDDTKNYALGANIVLYDTNDNNWGAIGTSSNPFQGAFDGLGHTVSNLNINKPTDQLAGLFGHIYSATIKNIGVVDASIIGKSYVGGLVGSSRSNSSISNSYSTGSVTGNNGYIGGLVGSNGSSTISNSYSTASVSGGDSATVGGLVGLNDSYSAISNSYSSSTSVKGGTGATLGGLVGVDDKGYDNIGEITHSYYDKDVNTGMSDADIYGKTTTQMQNIATYTTAIEDEDKRWNITEDSTMDSKYKYPILVTQNEVTSWKIYKGTESSNNGESSNNNGGSSNPPVVVTPPVVTPPVQAQKIADVVTTIVNTNSVKVELPKEVTTQVNTNFTSSVAATVVAPKTTITSSPMLATLETKLGITAGEGVSLSSITIEGTPTEIVTLSQLQTMSDSQPQANSSDNAASTTVTETRVALSENSIIDLINGGVHLPEGVDQQFYVTKTPKKKSN